MSKATQWFLIEDELEYNLASARYEEIKYAPKGSKEYREKLLLVHLIFEFKNQQWDLLAADPIEIIKIRMEEFGLKASDLAKEYGNKGNISKVLKYERALSLAMIRKFSKVLHIPTDMLIANIP